MKRHDPGFDDLAESESSRRNLSTVNSEPRSDLVVDAQSLITVMTAHVIHELQTSHPSSFSTQTASTSSSKNKKEIARRVEEVEELIGSIEVAVDAICLAEMYAIVFKGVNFRVMMEDEYRDDDDDEAEAKAEATGKNILTRPAPVLGLQIRLASRDRSCLRKLRAVPSAFPSGVFRF